jgi:hypothetical protein
MKRSPPPRLKFALWHGHLKEKVRFVIVVIILHCSDVEVHGALRHYATSQKVAGLTPDEAIGFFNLPNISSRTMALGSTQPLTEMSIRNLPGE